MVSPQVKRLFFSFAACGLMSSCASLQEIATLFEGAGQVLESGPVVAATGGQSALVSKVLYGLGALVIIGSGVFTKGNKK